jgi:hypothetical protein
MLIYIVHVYISMIKILIYYFCYCCLLTVPQQQRYSRGTGFPQVRWEMNWFFLKIIVTGLHSRNRNYTRTQTFVKIAVPLKSPLFKKLRNRKMPLSDLLQILFDKEASISKLPTHSLFKISGSFVRLSFRCILLQTLSGFLPSHGISPDTKFHPISHLKNLRVHRVFTTDRRYY